MLYEDWTLSSPAGFPFWDAWIGRPLFHLNRKNQNLELWRTAGDGSELNNNGVQIWNVTDAAVEHVTCCRCRSGGLVAAGVRRLTVTDFVSEDLKAGLLEEIRRASIGRKEPVTDDELKNWVANMKKNQMDSVIQGCRWKQPEAGRRWEQHPHPGQPNESADPGGKPS